MARPNAMGLPLEPTRPHERAADQRSDPRAADPRGDGRTPWSWRVGRVFGIPVDIHATFLLLLAWLGIAPIFGGQDTIAALQGVGLVLAVFATVVLHELAHAMVARRFGVRTRRILLLPIGGIASLEGMPERPSEELLVAIAGPLVNVAIALLLGAVLALTGQPLGPPAAALATSTFLVDFMWINVSIALLNLLPAFPMDGGRVLRAILAMRLDRDRATTLAASIGRGFAVVLGILGLMFQPMLLLIALFVWMAARAEQWLEHTRSVLHGVPIRRVMIEDVRVVSPFATVGDTAEVALSGFQHDFPVVHDDGRLAGLVTRNALLRALASGGGAQLVGEIMLASPVVAGPDEMLDGALERMERSGIGLMVVVEDGVPIGIVTAESALELVTQRDAAARFAGSTPREAALGRA